MPQVCTQVTRQVPCREKKPTLTLTLDRQTDKKAGRKADRQKIRQIVYALPLQENLGTGCTLGNIHTDKDTE